MAEDVGPDEVDTDLATAVGLLALCDVTVPEAASAADVTTWELEDAVESAELAETLDIESDADVGAQIDSLLDGDS